VRAVASRSPTRVLQNYSVAVGIFERFSLDLPVRVECLDRRVAELLEPLRGLLPLGSIWNIKHQKIVLGGRSPGRMPTLSRKLEVVSRCPMTQHDTIEAVVILEFVKNFEAEAIAIEFHDCGELIGRSRHPQMSFRETHRNVIRFHIGFVKRCFALRKDSRPARTISWIDASVRAALH
jgi:hypothetical protein